MRYIFVYLISFVGTKFLGLDRTILAFKKVGTFLRRFYRATSDADKIEQKLGKNLHRVPLAIKCLDQAIAAWFWLNLNGHKGVLRIGVSVTPLESHAWVVLGERVFVKMPSIPDLHVVAEYAAWD